MSLIRSMLTLVVLAGLLLFATTVEIGDHTLAGHLSRIWNAEETKDFVDSVREESKPALDRVKRGVEAGLEEAQTPPPTEANPANGYQADPPEPAPL